MHFTAVFNDQLVASEIIHNGGNLEIADNYGNTPLWTAVFNARGNYELVRLFLKNGANSLHKNNAGRSPLDFALQIKDEILVKLLSA
ncbi:MAG: ankyrin repeat domain-containing protein [Bacteroidia bacterium]|nr:ankyrin repeat domain-containing protein [Bacteroidia bacterium]